MTTYHTFFNGRKITLEASNLHEARCIAARSFNAGYIGDVDVCVAFASDSNEAAIDKNKIAVRPHVRDDSSHWLTIDLPEGWDTLKPLTNKVLVYEGRNYIFRGWNSDRNEAFFTESTDIATIK